MRPLPRTRGLLPERYFRSSLPRRDEHADPYFASHKLDRSQTVGFVTESLPQIRRRGALTARFQRASQRLQGTTFAVFPGEGYVASNPNCVPLRYILGVPNDDLLKALLVLDNGGPLGTRFKNFVKDRCGVELVRHDGTHGKNAETNTVISWYSFGKPSARTPADALRMPFSITDEDLDFIANQPQLCPPLERGWRGCPSYVLVRILERNGDEGGPVFARDH